MKYALLIERESYIEVLAHTLSAKEVEILDVGKEVATLQAKLQQKDELLVMEKERAHKLEHELEQRLEQDKSGNNLRSIVQEILQRVSSESVNNKSGKLAYTTRNIVD
jgi:hypothetical protein